MDLKLIFNDLRDEGSIVTFQKILFAILQTIVERKYSRLTITQTQ